MNPLTPLDVPALTPTTPTNNPVLLNVRPRRPRHHARETSSRNIATFVVSVYALGFTFGPLLAAPLSGIYGRAIVFYTVNLLFLAMTVATALSQNMRILIVFRFLMGFTGSTPVTNGSGTISDIFPVQQRGKAMAVWAMGPCIGPLAGGYMVEAISWRWVFCLIAILTGAIATLRYFAASETYAPTLLHAKAAKLKKETGNADLNSILDKDGLTPKKRLSNDSIRPLRMLFTQLPVFILSLRRHRLRRAVPYVQHLHLCICAAVRVWHWHHRSGVSPYRYWNAVLVQ
ncbi:hypothetical protein FOPG_18721 [Fusarium oxysporum f. sp. conglutinans race 2 54008]|uniref:Major facilitator superfamily (MFS) profile domain-containing protein n=1 Tax=Fusarium oxysporum f. sp. conglutinans race 2 54008 TaxID=1089457 RepID=X0GNZ7_FUSOX|nr:hypothetical protein FOPG_18721 [Fusarium oxysporum f. sp. conglutinans race 2 54008]KAG7000240.1 Efflux pump rdc3 [Fusarium oxysporum f. sp. conglutinans]KAI8416589.1 hypothetical protein FOFC_02901 [Fusarium oxysporum]